MNKNLIINEDLVDAAFNYRDDLVEKMLAAGANPDSVNEIGLSAVVECAYNGSDKALKMLLDAGANPDFLGDPEKAGETYGMGATPLIVAAGEGEVSCLKLLIAAGADLNHQMDTGDTALIAAIKARNGYCASLLVAAGADWSIKNNDKEDARDIADDMDYWEGRHAVYGH